MLSNVCGDAIALFVYYLLNRFFPAHEAQVAEAVHDVKNGELERSSSEEVDEGAEGKDKSGAGEGPGAEKQLGDGTQGVVSVPVSRQQSQK